ncbi:3H domain-containing protein [Gottschalkia purinilytica]|uniref:3H domain-containing protein n=1 Tax=Gottschalkia purinilytica TaxID=1503 RepID=A0A0L0W658_GOTPU|nr:3H domain-containing protein [Gottschalkia purinilytica]
MNTEDRRRTMWNILQREEKPIKGTKLAEEFNVSRQVIVQDIALLRAEGFDIIATPQGYVIPKYKENNIIKKIVTKHFNLEEMEEELRIMIDYGARVLDVIVEHPIYGEIKGILDIGYKEELDSFMKKLRQQKAEPLSSLTDGIHIHTIEVPSEENFNKIKDKLKEKNYSV